MRRLLAALFCLLPVVVLAAVTATPVFVQNPKQPKVQITNANGTTAQTLYACDADGTKVTGLIATSTDTVARDLQILVTRSATDYVLATVTIAAGAGTVAGTAPVNLLTTTNFPGLPTDSDGNPYFYCESTDTLKAGLLVAVTAAKVVNVVAVAADF
jgi:hypothetical protein